MFIELKHTHGNITQKHTCVCNSELSIAIIENE